MWRRIQVLGLLALLVAETAVIALPHDHRGEMSRVGVDHHAANHRGSCLTPLIAVDAPHHCLACTITVTCFELPQEAHARLTLPTHPAIIPRLKPAQPAAGRSQANCRAPPLIV